MSFSDGNGTRTVLYLALLKSSVFFFVPLLLAAKTFLDDGWSNLDMVTSADEVGGVWAMGESGGIYPGLLVRTPGPAGIDSVRCTLT